MTAMLHIDQGWARIKVTCHIVWAHLFHKSIGIPSMAPSPEMAILSDILRIDEHIGRLQ